MDFQVGGMDCAACAAAIEKAVCPLPGVREVRVDVMKGSVRVHAKARAAMATSRAPFAAPGYTVQDESEAGCAA